MERMKNQHGLSSREISNSSAMFHPKENEGTFSERKKTHHAADDQKSNILLSIRERLNKVDENKNSGLFKMNHSSSIRQMIADNKESKMLKVYGNNTLPNHDLDTSKEK